MAGLWTLLLLSTIMGGASFLAGLLPLSFSLSPRQLRLITALGTGVLVGTSLIVIIPEGVDTLYKASGKSRRHEGRSLSLVRRGVHESNNFAPDQYNEHWRRFAIPEDSKSLGDGLRSGPDDGFSTTSPDLVSVGADEGEDSGRHTRTGDAPEREPHSWIGVSIICGFILMYLIDTVPRQASERTQPASFPISLGQFSLNNASSTSTDEAATLSQDPATTDSSSKGPRPSSTTVGLVIHAAADGVALGASSTTSSNLSFVIFIALLIHKHVTLFPTPLPGGIGRERSVIALRKGCANIMQGASGLRPHIRLVEARLVYSGGEDAPDHLLACSSSWRASHLVCRSLSWSFERKSR